MTQNILSDILQDMRVELSDAFDGNFSQGGFFGRTWAQRRDGSASLLQGAGKLRRSIRGLVRGAAVVFASSEPYAAIHNEGGTMTVTRRMQRFFWAKYYQEGKKGAKAERYKAMALKRVGSKIVIPQRRYIGDAPQVRAAVEAIVKENIERYAADMAAKIQQK